MELIQSIEEFARKAHGNQQRKFEPGPYVIHLIRVKNICQEYTPDAVVLSAALLHDVLEDTEVKAEELRQFLQTVTEQKTAGNILNLVIDLTDIYTKNNYPQWNRRKRKKMEAERLSRVRPDAQTIKYADIIDNSHTIVHAEDGFASVYLHEARVIIDMMKKGHPELRSRAEETIRGCIAALK
jgi:guanosine-3',5'-bis(diphosphate) 3'-pyrophosphohydrolase